MNATVCTSSTKVPADTPSQSSTSGFLRCGNPRPYGACGHKVLVWQGSVLDYQGTENRENMATGDRSIRCPVCRKHHRFTRDYLKRLTNSLP